MDKTVRDPLSIGNTAPELKVVEQTVPSSAGPASGLGGRADNLARLVASQPDPHEAGLLANDYDELQINYQKQQRILWCDMRPRERPSFTHSLLSEIQLLQQRIRSLHANPAVEDQARPRYLVYRSAIDGVFNLGGDLRLIGKLVRRGDRQALAKYASACIEALYPNIVSLDTSIVTVSLVQGVAFGGGFEGALSNNVLVAEEGATFGLPEILFNLFPGMGAYSLLSRRIGAAKAERLIMSGKVYSAAEMYEMGVVDVLAPAGEGESKVREFVGKQQRRFNAYQAIYKARRRYQDLAFKELADIAEIWVEAAINLGPPDLKRIDKLADMQEKRFVIK